MNSIKLLFLAVLIIFLGCNKKTTDDNNNTNTCKCPDVNRACTMEFRMINVFVYDTTGQFYTLDDYYTQRLSDSKKVHTRDTLTSSENIKQFGYTVITDSELSLLDMCGVEFQFIGIKNGKVVVKSNYVVKSNCCHIELVKGENKITVR